MTPQPLVYPRQVWELGVFRRAVNAVNKQRVYFCQTISGREPQLLWMPRREFRRWAQGAELIEQQGGAR